ncbi:KpsF/GutQ family sugar-phosphate isomerase [Prosthecomicrobium pneumaticum]|uniref:Arabinose-5-phosphate isomerase n=1 Tax=Prosthecomicrobium pneumaticum TaxID=81895 RepID=A0A7W9CV89_9HYPH|nr:KpsF/GutQ family sugar-phosphate isomerase [Prosthecomicrobium pneumaticum]MBB5752525.1 arabinose-5-phosphate isomerase [Prosthecomicrobium pneumaticum]
MAIVAIRPADDGAVASALRTIERERAGLDAIAEALAGPLGRALAEAVGLIRAATGRVVVTGIGKSGHIGAKVAATLASTGTPAFFLHAAEASHGDLGMVAAGDVVLALSFSGESAELRAVVEYARRFRLPLVAMTSAPGSALGRAADLVLALPQAAEACPHGLAPTTSTVMQLALGDALAVALLESRGFTAQEFRVFHPGGKLGANLNYVRDIMHAGEAVPLLPLAASVSEAILVMTAKGFGCVGIVDGEGALAGIITDGDLRRHLGPALLEAPVERVMTRAPRTIAPDTLVAAAVEQLNRAAITALFVVEERRPVGIVHMHDLLRIGVA